MTISSPDRFADPALIEGIAREVIRRLVGVTADSVDGEVCPRAKEAAIPEGERLITIDTLDRLSGATEVVSAPGGVVTPAAREEAAARGIKIIAGRYSANGNAAIPSTNKPLTPGDEDPRCEIIGQLNRRGISLPEGIELIWTDQPAAEVFRICGSGQRAAMINSLSDVDRFAAELAPQVWVLDRQKLNLIAAVNVAARIARCKPGATRSNGGSQ